ncbi:MAG: magnesium protoporphyrin IX methyltransferase [Burkholderiaceae bacterium]
MGDGRYTDRRSQIEHYFDRTAVQAWARLTSDAPVSGVRATVRKGRDEMRRLIGSWIGDEPGHTDGREIAPSSPPVVQRIRGRRVLDAGCGTGMLAIDLARQGARVTAVDLSPNLVQLARERLPEDLGGGSVTFFAGDMLDEQLGLFDHVVAMDSLIHYSPHQAMAAISALAPRVNRSMVLTFAPRTGPLMAMMAVGRLFPRGDRSPAIHPVSLQWLRESIEQAPSLSGWKWARTHRVSCGFYTSQAVELVRP